VDAGANGAKTGRNVDSLTKIAYWGCQKSGLANQLPNFVEGSFTGSSTDSLMRSKSFFVARIEYTRIDLARRTPPCLAGVTIH
jgi:hypothetical protein